MTECKINPVFDGFIDERYLLSIDKLRTRDLKFRLKNDFLSI